MPVELVSVYEEEFYRFYKTDVVYFPLKLSLDCKDNKLQDEIVSFVIWHFTAFFVEFAHKSFNFGSNV